EDLAWFGATGAPEDAIAQWLDLGPKLVVMTGGSKGATGYTKNQRVTVTPKPVTVVDTVGAGDTFNAGILASLHEQGALSKPRLASLSETEIRDALALGAAAASVTVSRAGANPPWRHELG
ncbi:MAG: PfkB family carbohydrate kinase, partial [Pseudomonadota bacterium]|nr:PfkB family carbohydrate kinase [Pseudomonadota bacterium]